MTTNNLYESLDPIMSLFKGILLDAYGVFWGGNTIGPLTGAKECMEKFVSLGKIVGVLSNTTQSSDKEIAKLLKHGFIQGHHFHFFITSGDIAKKVFQNHSLPFPTPNKKFWLFGQAHPKFSSHQDIFNNTCYRETLKIEEADFIYISIPHINGEDQTDPEKFEYKLREIQNCGLPMVCTNPDHFAHEGSPPKAVVRQGSIASIYEKLGGQVFFIGKPSSLAFNAALDRYSEYQIDHPKNILMIGDTPETDIKGARHIGMSSALITQTGIMADRIYQLGFEKAIQVLNPNETPDFYIKRFA